MSLPPDDRLARLLGGDGLAGLRRRLRRRYELAPSPGDPECFRLAQLTPEEHGALAALMGRPPRFSDSLHVDVGLIDSNLRRAGIAPSLRHALERLDGPIVHRATALDQARAAWSEAAAGCRHPALARLLQAPGGLGLLKRLAAGNPDAAGELRRRADAVLQHLPAAGAPRAQLAAQVLGDAHALDDGRPVATVVLAALRTAAAWPGELNAPDPEAPETYDPPDLRDERARDVWAAHGILVNELARPALFLNLPSIAAGDRQHSPGEPAFASLRLLLRSPPAWDVSGRTIYVCENPNLVAIAADRLGARCAPLVCTDGMPAAAQRTLLAQLAAAGACLRVHADFDWPGVHIARHVMRTHRAQPWRLGASDYEAAVRGGSCLGLRLDDLAVETAWDGGLADAMRRHRRAIAEEAVSDLLLSDLARRA